MEFSVAEMFGASAMIASSGMPGLRLFAVQKNGSGTRLPDIKASQYGERGWVASSPATACGAEYGNSQDYCEPHCAYSPIPAFDRPTWGYFSAVCLVHGMRLLNETGRPQGLIESAWGGSEIELWSSQESRAKCPSTWCPGWPVRGRCPRDGLYFAGMIAPLVHMPIRGALWFQGEANSATYGAPTGDVRSANHYSCQLEALISDWRSRWYRSANMSWGVVQLAPAGDASEGTLRWAQSNVVSATARAYLAVTIDLYDKHSPCGAIHIRNKTAVANRLAVGTLASMNPNKTGAVAASNGGPVPMAAFTWPTIRFSVQLELRGVVGMTIAGALHGNFETTSIARPGNASDIWGGWEAVKQVSVVGNEITMHTTDSRSETAMGGVMAVKGIRCAYCSSLARRRFPFL